MRHRTTATLTLVVALAAGTLTACSSDDAPSVAESTASASATDGASEDATDGPTRAQFPDGVTVGLPAGVQAPGEASAGAGWGADGTSVWVVTYGSSTNPTFATITSAESGTLTVALSLVNPDGPGTMDYVPTTTVLDLPAGVDTRQPVQVVLGDLGTVQVTADAPGWLTASGE